jgi:phosphoglycolate phosphatase
MSGISSRPSRKLVLFDIDGTLIYHVDTFRFEDQYEMAMREIYNVKDPFSISRYNGTVERYIAWDMVRKYGISRKEFLEKFPAYISAMRKLLETRGKKDHIFVPIADSLELVKKLSGRPHISLGIITGNAERTAQWKLSHTGFGDYFHFGLYGDEADDRVELARLVFAKARRELHRICAPSDVIIVGDTVYDIRCGKAVGAMTVAVTTGKHGPKVDFSVEHPDLIVDSLMDDRVLDLFSLK